MVCAKFCSLLALAAAAPAAPPPAPKPHIILITLDDWGFNQVGWHAKRWANANEIRTPHMDALVADGVELDRAYVFRFCSPSRCALLSGRNPVHINVLNSDLTQANLSDPVAGFAGLPRPVTAIAEKLRSPEGGYGRAIFAGKHHAGLATPDHLPKGRGYDSSLAYLSGANGLWNDWSTGVCPGGAPNTDLWLDDTPAYGLNNSWACSQAAQAGCEYEDDLIADFAVAAVLAHNTSAPMFLHYAPHGAHVGSGLQLEVPDAVLANFSSFINNTYRARYAAIVSIVDGAVGRIVAALRARGMYDNALIVALADNGGPIIGPTGSAGGNNWPLRGGKSGNFEGGIRAAAFVSGGALPPARRGAVERARVSVEDWYATFCALAGVDPRDARGDAAGLPPVDGVNLWPLLSGANATPPRAEVVIGADGDGVDSDGITLVQGLIRAADGYKLLVGRISSAIWQGELYPNASTDWQDVPVDCGGLRGAPGGCLFNIYADPHETVDVAAQQPAVLAEMRARLAQLQAGAYSPLRGPDHPEACNVSAAKWGGFVGPFLP